MAADHAGQMHTEKWQLGVRNRIDQMPYDFGLLVGKPEVLAAERSDAKLDVQPRRSSQPIRLQAGAGDELVRTDRLASGQDDLDLVGSLYDTMYGGAQAELAALLAHLLCQRSRDQSIVHDAGTGYQEAREPGDARFDYR